MAFRLVSSGGNVADPAIVNLAASGGINAGEPVEFVRSGTGGAVVAPASVSSTVTNLFGVSYGPNIQGASDTFTGVCIFGPSQVWEVDCANSGSTAQVGLRHALSASRGFIHNTASDVSTATGVALALALVGATTGSGKLLCRLQSNQQLIPVNSTTFLQ